MSKFAGLTKMLVSAGVIAAAIPTAAAVPPAADDGSAPNADEYVTVDQAQAMVAASLEAGEKKGFKASTDRMVAVMESDAGKANPQGAVALMARAPDMSAEDVIATLAAVGVIPPAAVVAPPASAVAADLKDTPKVDLKTQPNSGQSDDGAVDATAFWDSVQGTKGGVKIGAAH